MKHSSLTTTSYFFSIALLFLSAFSTSCEQGILSRGGSDEAAGSAAPASEDDSGNPIFSPQQSSEMDGGLSSSGSNPPSQTITPGKPDSPTNPGTANPPDSTNPPNEQNNPGTTPPDRVSGIACQEEWFQGDGTYYGADGGGNCMFDPNGNLDVGAMNHDQYADSATCGTCVFVEGPLGNLTVRIVDQCPECKPGDIDFSAEAFAKIAKPSDGRVAIRWKYVPCQTNGPIAYRFKEGSSQYWTAVQIRNHTNQVAKFEYRKAGGTFTEAQRTSYNYFLAESGMGAPPLEFRVTDIYGQVLTDTVNDLGNGNIVNGEGQFPACKAPSGD